MIILFIYNKARLANHPKQVFLSGLKTPDNA